MSKTIEDGQSVVASLAYYIMQLERQPNESKEARGFRKQWKAIEEAVGDISKSLSRLNKIHGQQRVRIYDANVKGTLHDRLIHVWPFRAEMKQFGPQWGPELEAAILQSIENAFAEPKRRTRVNQWRSFLDDPKRKDPAQQGKPRTAEALLKECVKPSVEFMNKTNQRELNLWLDLDDVIKQIDDAKALSFSYRVGVFCEYAFSYNSGQEFSLHTLKGQWNTTIKYEWGDASIAPWTAIRAITVIDGQNKNCGKTDRWVLWLFLKTMGYHQELMTRLMAVVDEYQAERPTGEVRRYRADYSALEPEVSSEFVLPALRERGKITPGMCTRPPSAIPTARDDSQT